MITKHGLPYTIREKADIPTIRTVLDRVLHLRNTKHVLRLIHLSNNTVKRHMDEMGECTEKKLLE